MLSINCKGSLISFEEPQVMGILNATPDSFFPGSRVTGQKAALQKAEELLLHGAGIIDIGGQSTRPGSERISEEEELKRVMPVVEAVIKNFPLSRLSIDSFYAKVVKYAVEAGACMVNDISAGTFDEEMIPTVAALGVPYILMHMQGNPQTMQQGPRYENIVLDVFDTLNFQLQKMHDAGITDVIIDPGFGFGKTFRHNFQLLSQLSYFKNLGHPIMVGLSRKATIYKTLNIPVEDALNGTTVLHTLAVAGGANILRVHDVKEAREAVVLYQNTQAPIPNPSPGGRR
jgi:dihydropteroate synthase